jgi:hypothetical protein
MTNKLVLLQWLQYPQLHWLGAHSQVNEYIYYVHLVLLTFQFFTVQKIGLNGFSSLNSFTKWAPIDFYDKQTYSRVARQI